MLTLDPCTSEVRRAAVEMNFSKCSKGNEAAARCGRKLGKSVGFLLLVHSFCLTRIVSFKGCGKLA